MAEGPTRRRLLAAAGAAAGLAGCSTGFEGPDETGSPTGTTPGGEPTDRPGDGGGGGGRGLTGEERPSAYTRAYREVAPSVVRVRVADAEGGGLGSGIVREGGQVVTNEHVVAGATDVSVVYGGGGFRTAEVVGTDVYSDLAVLSVPDHPGERPPLSVAREDPAVGARVLAVGTPFGLAGSVTAGVVSGVDRSLPGPRGFRVPDAVQTDAAANPGNSGGPLVGLSGTALGLVNSGAGNDVTFAISGALMGRVLPALADGGGYAHPYLGVGLRELTPPLARANDLSTLRGAYVHEVRDGAPAAGALRGSDGAATALGERVPTGGDVVVALDGRPVPDAGGLGAHLALRTRPGDALDVTVRRNGRRETRTVRLAKRPRP